MGDFKIIPSQSHFGFTTIKDERAGLQIEVYARDSYKRHQALADKLIKFLNDGVVQPIERISEDELTPIAKVPVMTMTLDIEQLYTFATLILYSKPSESLKNYPQLVEARNALYDTLETKLKEHGKDV